MDGIGIKLLFDKAAGFAQRNRTCIKVGVGALFIDKETCEEYYSCNRSLEHDCIKHNECYKAKVTGIYESCEETRKFCKSVHAEINMINQLRQNNVNPFDGDLWVTRYPCLNCAKEIVKAGFNKVYYCGKQEISDDVKKVFEDGGIEVEWHPEYDYEF